MKSYGRTTPVDQFDLDMTFIRTHDSIKVAAKFFGVSVQMISMNCRGLKKLPMALSGDTIDHWILKMNSG
jgi:hypothetical protein